MGATCPSDNTQAIDQSSFWANGTSWDSHRTGWIVAGSKHLREISSEVTDVFLPGCALVVRSFPLMSSNSLRRVEALITLICDGQTVLISSISVLLHCRYVLFVGVVNFLEVSVI
jgi:hypothetical protein